MSTTRPIPEKQATQPQRRRLLLSAVSLAATGALLGCGGGEDDESPTISLAAIPLSGVVGATITLSANADDDNGLKRVVFYRVTATAEEVLVTFTRFTSGPLLHQVVIPVGATGSVSYRATAIDDDDQETVSNTVIVTVTTS